jgi:hypothetical protein
MNELGTFFSFLLTKEILGLLFDLSQHKTSNCILETLFNKTESLAA